MTAGQNSKRVEGAEMGKPGGGEILPGVRMSRKAIARVKNPLPPPVDCRYCGSPVRIMTHDEVYGRGYNDWPLMYCCTGCGARVGMHPFTDFPLGILANSELRDARKHHKAAFNQLLSSCAFDGRNEAYAWLADAMGIAVEACHWGWFDLNDCERAGALCRAKLEGAG